MKYSLLQLLNINVIYKNRIKELRKTIKLRRKILFKINSAPPTPPKNKQPKPSKRYQRLEINSTE